MNLVFLHQVGGILKPFSWILGVILNAIYEFVNLFGIQNIALCIIIFTFVTKMLMLPLTIKQQKYSRLSAKMSPELTKINAKYKGKKDETSVRKQQAEMQEVYQKYGSSPMGGCLPLLISMPILFALYRVIYAVPAYVTILGDLYAQIATAVQAVPGHAEVIGTFITENNIAISADILANAGDAKDYMLSLTDVFSQFNTLQWTSFFDTRIFADISSSVMVTLNAAKESILNANNLFGLNILDPPKWNSISVIIPVLSVASQFVQGKLQQADATTQNADNPAAKSMKTMTTIMPIMSGVFCLMLPIGVGIYWIASSVFQILQQIFINRHLDKIDLDDMIEKNLQKSTKKKAKMGIDVGNKMAGVAKTSTKTIENREQSMKAIASKNYSASNYKKSNVSHNASSIAANANLLAGRNKEKNSKDESKTSEE